MLGYGDSVRHEPHVIDSDVVYFVSGATETPQASFVPRQTPLKAADFPCWGHVDSLGFKAFILLVLTSLHSMSLPAGDVAYGLYEFDGMDLMKTGTQSKMKRPRSPAGVFEGSRSISDGELSGEESNSYCSSSSLSSSNSKSLEDFSSLFVFDKDELSSATATSFESIYEDHAPLTNIITDSFISFEEDSADTVSSGADEISAKRRKKLSALVPYPRIPRTAEYQCSNCSHNYSRIVADNSWWAVYRHDCPSCHTNQVPRIDISKEENAIELDPNVVALYGEGVEDSADENYGDDEESGEEESETSFVRDAEELDVSGSVPTCYVAEGNLSPDKASKLLVLMCHAKSCNGTHTTPANAKTCMTTKRLMLHLRDCKDKNCKRSSCAPTKNILQHISLCGAPAQCNVCSPKSLPESFLKLHRLNQSLTK